MPVPVPSRLRLATRKSALALWQTEHVAARLRQAHPGLEVELVPMSTRGDEVLDRSLSAIGGKGLFLKELEIAMLEGRADAAVHSLKDVPMELDGPFALGAVLERADAADAFVSVAHPDLDGLPEGARVGTSSLRRKVQLRARRPDLRILDLRGNVLTRLGKLDAGGYDAIVLACAGLQRLGVAGRITARLDPPAWVPAVAQGAIAVECRADDAGTHALFAALDHAPTRARIAAERAMNLALHGSCHAPVGGYAELDGARLRLIGLVGSESDPALLRGEAEGDAAAPEELGRRLAADLLARGADRLLHALPK
ncbi:hydroxymethylbilane synthase [Coralloluteibacterium stylophorae]|uniref:Porphobilinogen deaminase n=1 Tax=Coralloluteibacterium stylophorae TaxID=1776034 RepID=A0A8J8AXN5_9GAMM|nr:hydroxymethylbilane synthase [Coralloluteibacterium stylophorae]MBS7458827.1 hydroxymethylbilane synthase [Coralloluteibacterium stylophorae]